MARRSAIQFAKADLTGHRVDPDAMPDSAKMDLCRVIFQEVRKFFSDPGVQADYQKWLSEYRRTHPEKAME